MPRCEIWGCGTGSCLECSRPSQSVVGFPEATSEASNANVRRPNATHRHGSIICQRAQRRRPRAGPDEPRGRLGADVRHHSVCAASVDWPLPGRWLVEAVSQGWGTPPGPILDIGCGAVSNALWLSHHGFRVTGLDLAPIAIAVAKRRASKTKSSAVFAQGSILSVPYRDAAFWSAIDSGCFHSLPIADSNAVRQRGRAPCPSGMATSLSLGSRGRRPGSMAHPIAPPST